MLNLQPLHRGSRTFLLSALLLLLSSALFISPIALHAQRVTISARDLAAASTEANAVPIETGLLPGSQPVTVTLRLKPNAARAAALDQLLAAQVDAASPSYHYWLTPQRFADQFGATDEEVASITAWAQTQGLTVGALSAGKTRLVLSGTAQQVQGAFLVSLHRYLVGGSARFAPAAAPSVPVTLGPLISAVSGLDDTAITVSPDVSATSFAGRASILSNAGVDALSILAAAVDENLVPIITLSTVSCSGALELSDLAAYRSILRQANAEGITVLASSGCVTGDAATRERTPLLKLPEVTAFTTAPLLSASAQSDSQIAVRPDWQVAPGLPSDVLRHEPDLTTASGIEFSQALAGILRHTGIRQGNINSVLYSLASTPDLYTQPDAVAAGTWEALTGLGVVDLAILAKVFPKVAGTFVTTTSFSSSLYVVNYGQGFTLTAKVLAPIYTNASPTGTVAFTSTQGTLGTATIDSSGTATLNLTTPMNAGTYSLTATYSGDANYASSANATAVIVTVSIVNAKLVATVSPSAGVPYGSTATITATVALPQANAVPSGIVSASVVGITAASYIATLSPNPGGNSATANIIVPTPPPGSYSLEVGCTGNSNYVCQTPATVSITTIKGNTLTNVTVTPVAPEAGQPVAFVASVATAGNGPGPYTFTGNMTFYDNGKLIATVVVASNQASTSATLTGNVSHNIIAIYSGDTNWGTSTSTAKVVNPTLLPSTLTLSPNVSSALAGVNIVFTATVFTNISNSVGPTGLVSFYDTYNGSIFQLGGTTGAVTLTPNGPNQSIARFTTTGLLAGMHSLYAVYNGDANFAPATSVASPLTLTDYLIVMNPQTLTLKVGQTGQVVAQLGLVNGFTGTVSFGCTPPSGAEATCSFSPASLQGGGTTTMKVLTTAARAKPVQQADVSKPFWPKSTGSTGAASAIAMLFWFALPRRRRALPLLLTTLLAVSLSPNLGCGTGSSSIPTSTTPADSGTPLGTQIFNITTSGTDGVNSIRHNYQFQVTVQ